MSRASFGVAALMCWLATSRVGAQAREAEADALERALRESTQLALVERIALARNPTLSEAEALRAALAERARGAARFPDPELKYEQWGVPLDRPYALNRADTLMFGLRQAFPAPGARAARARVADADVFLARQERALAQRELLLRVRRAYFDYYAADRALAVHLEHVDIAERINAQVRADYEAGRGTQQDMLKVLVELSRVHNDVAQIRQQRESSRFLLNALMARAPDAPLGPPAGPERPSSVPALEQLEHARSEGRPELAVAAGNMRRAQAVQEAAQIGARRPSFMVGADYWWMPLLEMPHAYGVMVSMSLPWLVPGRRAELREAEQLAAAERHAAEAVDRLTAFELHDAMARLQAADHALAAIQDSVLPQAERSLASSQAAFALGNIGLLPLLDALRAFFQIRLEHSRALSRVMTELAQLEFASGATLISAKEERP